MKNHKALFTFIVIGLLNTLVIAQTDTLPKKKTTFGVAVGYIQGQYKIKKTNWEANGLGDTLSGVSQKSEGFSLVIQLNFPVTSKLSVRVQSGFSFDDLTFIFLRKDGKNWVSTRANVYLNIPIDVVYTFTEMKINPSVIVGMRYMRSFDNWDYKRGMVLSLNDFGYYIGTGINKHLRRFTIRPEILYNFSPFNILRSENIFAPFKAISAIQRNYIDFKIIASMKTI